MHSPPAPPSKEQLEKYFSEATNLPLSLQQKFDSSHSNHMITPFRSMFTNTETIEKLYVSCQSIYPRKQRICHYLYLTYVPCTVCMAYSRHLLPEYVNVWSEYAISRCLLSADSPLRINTLWIYHRFCFLVDREWICCSSLCERQKALELSTAVLSFWWSFQSASCRRDHKMTNKAQDSLSTLFYLIVYLRYLFNFSIN